MALTTTQTTNSDSVVNRQIQLCTTDSSTAAAIVFSFGFRPRKLTVINLTALTVDLAYDGMAAGSTIHTVAAGTTTAGASLITWNTDNTVTIAASALPASSSFVIEAEG